MTKPPDTFRADVVAGLSRAAKELPCKYFYDEAGARLFDRICDLPEYYLTRAELEVMGSHAGEMAAALGAGCLVIEYGSGSSLKTPLLMSRLRYPAGYVPVDISREHLYASAAALAARLPGVEVRPVWADFTERFDVPAVAAPVRRRVVYFPGSTVGNFGPDDALRLLTGIAALCGPGGGLLVGVDLRKPAAVIEPAYNDRAGVTAAFNRNLLVRINRELGADFDPARFDHRAFFNAEHSRVEMHLVSREPQVVRVGGAVVRFAAGESVRTECSYKYAPEAFRRLAAMAGLEVVRTWTDAHHLFSVQLLAVGS